ncbi:unnamed protein product, partial [marine sediment metagenome]
KMIRQIRGISSEKAIALADYRSPLVRWPWILDELDYGKINDPAYELYKHIIDVLGKKKDGKPTKLAKDFIHWLETGEML